MYEITLSNGASFFVSERTVRDKRLEAGMELSEREWELAARADEHERCYAKGLALCARMEQTRAVLSRKLTIRGYSAEAVESACTRLAREGFLDDGRFALAWARGRLRRRREGPLLIELGLLRKGVGRPVIENALRRCEEEGLLEEALSAAREAALPRCGSDVNELKRILLQRGFKKNTISHFLERY